MAVSTCTQLDLKYLGIFRSSLPLDSSLHESFDFESTENLSRARGSSWSFTKFVKLSDKVEILSYVLLRGLARSPASADALPLCFRSRPRRRNGYGQWKIGVSKTTSRFATSAFASLRHLQAALRDYTSSNSRR